MSRYRGPRLRVLRALQTPLPGLTAKQPEKPQPPGEHGQKRQRRRTEYGLQLMEKQKLRFNYHLSERQLRRLMLEARSSRAATGDKLIELLERRLDNVVFRAGLAPTIPAARQLVNHGHLKVGGRRVDIPSFRVSQGDVIELRPRSRKLAVVQESLQRRTLPVPDWLSVEADEPKVTVQQLPGPDSTPLQIDTRQVVEFYAKYI